MLESEISVIEQEYSCPSLSLTTFTVPDPNCEPVRLMVAGPEAELGEIEVISGVAVVE